MGAPLGNDNACKDRDWTKAIRRALALADSASAESDPAISRRQLIRIAEVFLDKAADGDMAALKELGDRLDGKPHQALDLGSDPNRPVIQKIVREIVRTPHTDG